MCHHTREPTVLSRVSCRPSHLNVDRFHQPFLLPWRTHLLPPITAGCWERVGEDCHLRTTWRPLTLAGSPVLPPCVSLEVFATPNTRYHGRTLIRLSLSPACAEGKGCLHTRRFGTLVGPPPPVVRMPWGPHPPGHVIVWHYRVLVSR